MSRNTIPGKLQSQHWERTGQICSMIGLINYILHQHKNIPINVMSALNSAKISLIAARNVELQNNEFINLSKKVRWK